MVNCAVICILITLRVMGLKCSENGRYDKKIRGKKNKGGNKRFNVDFFGGLWFLMEVGGVRNGKPLAPLFKMFSV